MLGNNSTVAVAICVPLNNDSGAAVIEHPVPEYYSPYSKEIAPTPTLEQMQVYVCNKNVRPLFPPAVHKASVGALHDLRVLIEDCWDRDADARIAALCAHKRLIDLQHLANVLDGVKSDNENRPIGPAGIAMYTNEHYLSYTQLGRPIHQFGDRTMDSGTTSGVGSMSMHSTDRGRSVNSSLGYRTATNESPTPLQPYQGLNPCQERNLLVESSSDESSATRNRITESQFRKIDPCNALLALVANRVGETDPQLEDARGDQCAFDKCNASGSTPRMNSVKEHLLALLLMEGEQNRPEQENVDDNVAGNSGTAEVREHVSAEGDGDSIGRASNDSGNCTTASSTSDGHARFGGENGFERQQEVAKTAFMNDVQMRRKKRFSLQEGRSSQQSAVHKSCFISDLS